MNEGPDREAPSGFGSSQAWNRAGLFVVFLWFLVGGSAHFALTDTFMRIVPPWVPWPKFAVLASGALELIGAAAILWQPTRRVAGWGLLSLTLAVTPANIYMLQQYEQFQVPYGALLLRLPLQVVLLALIWWSTIRRMRSASASRAGFVELTSACRA